MPMRNMRADEISVSDVGLVNHGRGHRHRHYSGLQGHRLAPSAGASCVYHHGGEDRLPQPLAFTRPEKPAAFEQDFATTVIARRAHEHETWLSGSLARGAGCAS